MLPDQAVFDAVEAARLIVRVQGLDGLSMRHLAPDLDTAPSSLYRHIKDRREILVILLDDLAGAIEAPPASDDPSEEAAAAAQRHLRSETEPE